MMCESSNLELFRRINLQSGAGVAGLMRQLNHRQRMTALKKSINHLTTAERELLAMKFQLNTPPAELLKRFGFASREILNYRIAAITKMLQAFFVYFALNDHEDTVARLNDYFGPGSQQLLAVFSGARPVYGGYKCADVENIDNKNVRAFITTLIEVSKYKRL